MAEPRNCRRCGKIFTYAGGMPICSECIKKDEEDFNKIREYLYENPKATIIQIAEALEIPLEKIMRYLREGRLETANATGLKLECERCGKSINVGRFCSDCTEKLQGSLKTLAKNMDLKADSDNTKEGERYYNRKLEIISKKDTKKKD